MVRISNGPDHEPNVIDHPNSEHVRNSSPHCTKAICRDHFIGLELKVGYFSHFVVKMASPQSFG